MGKFIVDNIQWLVTVIGITVAWFVGDQKILKNKAKLSEEQVDSAKLGNITANFKVYQDLINDLEDRFKKRIDELEIDLEKMKTLNQELRRAISNQEKYIKKLQEKLDSYEKLEG